FVLGAGILVWAVTQVFTGFVGSLSQFLAARICLGTGEAPIFPAGARVIADWFKKSERGVPTGSFLSSTTIVPVLAPPVITALMLALGGRHMYMALVLAGVVLAAIWVAFARDHKSIAFTTEEEAYFEQSGPPNAKLGAAGYAALLSQRSVWGLVLGFVG